MIFVTAIIFSLCVTTITSLEFNFKPFSLMTKMQKPKKIQGIVQLLNGINSGLIKTRNDDIITLIKDLQTTQPIQTKDCVLVGGNWELLWTTEKVLMCLSCC
jgi:hypothetical protein